MSIRIVEHPLARHLVTRLRAVDTEPAQFRAITNHLSILLALEATRDLSLEPVAVETPLERTQGQALDGPLVVVAILRAGLGMLPSFVEIFPDVAVGYVGLERDHATAVAAAYYCKLPALAGRTVLIVDPMLATGGSACQAVDAVKARGGENIRLICVVAAPEGVRALGERHPDVPIIGAALDRELDARKYILPGLGDFGDRLYGTS